MSTKEDRIESAEKLISQLQALGHVGDAMAQKMAAAVDSLDEAISRGDMLPRYHAFLLRQRDVAETFGKANLVFSQACIGLIDQAHKLIHEEKLLP